MKFTVIFSWSHQLLLCHILSFSPLWLSEEKKICKAEAHGSHSSPEKQIQSINTSAQNYDYILTLIERKKITRIEISLYLLQLRYPLPKKAVCKVSLKMCWERFSNFVNIFALFHYHVPLAKGMVLHLYRLDSLYQNFFSAKFGWIDLVVLGNKVFKFCNCIFNFSLSSPLGEGCGPSFVKVPLYI